MTQNCLAKSCEKLATLWIDTMFIKSKTRKISIHDADVVSEEENEVWLWYWRRITLINLYNNQNDEGNHEVYVIEVDERKAQPGSDSIT